MDPSWDIWECPLTSLWTLDLSNWVSLRRITRPRQGEATLLTSVFGVASGVFKTYEKYRKYVEPMWPLFGEAQTGSILCCPKSSLFRESLWLLGTKAHRQDGNWMKLRCIISKKNIGNNVAAAVENEETITWAILRSWPFWGGDFCDPPQKKRSSDLG